MYYDAETGVLEGNFSHDGGGEATPTQEFNIEMQLHDAGGRRLDRDGEYVFSFTEELPATWWHIEATYDPAVQGPLPAGWASLTLLLRARTTMRDELFPLDCTDGDGQGESRTVETDTERFDACYYRRSDLEAPAPVPALPLGGYLLGAILTAGLAVRRRRRLH